MRRSYADLVVMIISVIAFTFLFSLPVQADCSIPEVKTRHCDGMEYLVAAGVMTPDDPYQMVPGTLRVVRKAWVAAWVCDLTDMCPYVATPPVAPVGELVPNGKIINFYLPAGKSRLFRSYANGTHKNWPVQVNLEEKVQSDGFCDYDQIVKYAGRDCEFGPPTDADYYAIRDNYTEHRKHSNNSGQAEFFYTIATNSFEFAEIVGIPDQPHGCYYTLVVDTERLGSGKQCLVNWSFTDADAPLDKFDSASWHGELPQ